MENSTSMMRGPDSNLVGYDPASSCQLELLICICPVREGPTWQLTGAVDDSSLRFALLLEDCLDILGLQKTGDLIDTHLRPNGLVLAQHLCAQAGCRLASREVGTVHTRLVNDDIVVGRTGAKRGGEVIEQRGAGLDICGVRQDPKGGAVSWP